MLRSYSIALATLYLGIGFLSGCGSDEREAVSNMSRDDEAGNTSSPDQASEQDLGTVELGDSVASEGERRSDNDVVPECDPSQPVPTADPCMDCSCDGSGAYICEVRADGTACVADPNACTAGDSCFEGICVSGAAIELDDGNPCTTGICVKGSVEQALLDGSCSDGDPCTVGDRCVLGQCVPEALKECPDEICRTAGWCDSDMGFCVYEPLEEDSPCGDVGFCGGSGQCKAGTCIYGQMEACDDGDLCTVDQCEQGVGCTHTLLVCPEGSCQIPLACDPEVGECAYEEAKDGAPCEAPGLCDEEGFCSDGVCSGDAKKICNDEDPCTADSCAPDTGCVFEEIIPCVGDGFATWNPLDKHEDILLSNGNLTITVAEDSLNNTLRATHAKTEGRWYWEIRVEVAGDSSYNGICLADAEAWLEVAPGCSDPGLNYKRSGHYCVASDFFLDQLPGYGEGDVVGIALDADASEVYLRVNGVWLMGADPEELDGGLNLGFSPGTPIFPCANISQLDVYTANFGQQPFEYSVPDGFAAGLNE